jgi:hypothetical protein
MPLMHAPMRTLAAAAISAGTAGAVAQEPVFEGLGFPAGVVISPNTRAMAITSDGSTVVGAAILGHPAVWWFEGVFVWTAGGGMSLVFPESIRGVVHYCAVSDTGDICGSKEAAPGTSDEGFRIVGGVPTTSGFDRFFGYSRGGQWAVGMGWDHGAFRWSPVTGYEFIGGQPDAAAARDITPAGDMIVGGTFNYPGTGGGFVWTPGAGFSLIGGLPGVPGSDCSLYAVAAGGSVAAGSVINAAGNVQPVRWYPGRGLRIINNLAGYDAGRALDVSDDGEVIIGEAIQFQQPARAFVWDRVRGTRDLRSYLIQLGSIEVAGWTLRTATAVSADGRVIAGWGTDPQGHTQAYVARVPAFCYANCDISVSSPVLTVLDFNCFLNRFALGSDYANCDGSTVAPVLNVQDFGCFLNRFTAGCP